MGVNKLIGQISTDETAKGYASQEKSAVIIPLNSSILDQ